MNKYSFWILPPKVASEKIQKAINLFSETYSAPRFFPHISTTFSIKGNIEDIEKKVNALNFKPIKINLAKLSTGELRWKQVFVRVENSPELKNIQNTLKTTFKESIVKEQKEPFDPHISLIYANNEPGEQFLENKKQEILKKAKTFEFEKKMLIDSIFLIDITSKAPEEWKIIKEIKF